MNQLVESIEQTFFCAFAVSFLTINLMRLKHAFSKTIKKEKKAKRPDQVIPLDNFNGVIATIGSEETAEKPPPPPVQTLNTQSRKEFVKLVVNSYLSSNSALIFVGLISETYLYGGRLLGNLISISIGYVIAALILQPFMYDLQLVDKTIKTPYQYLEKRYRSKSVRIAACLVGGFFYISFSSLFLWSCSVILTTVYNASNLQFWASSIILGIYSLSYALLGGLPQSTLMNFVQFMLFLIGTVTAIVYTFVGNKSKSADELWALAYEYGRRNFIEPSGDFRTRYTIWNQVFSLPIPWFTMHGLLIPSFLRYRSIDKKLKSRLFILSNLPIMFAINFVILLGGICSFMYFYSCDPLTNQEIQNKNQIAPYWILNSLSSVPALGGITLASILSAGMIVHSSGMVSIANSIMDDILQPLKLNKFYDNSFYRKFIVKALIIFILTCLSVGYSVGFKYAKNTILSLFFLFNNSYNSPIFALFILSMFNPYANWFGALASFVCCVAINTWLGMSALIFSTLKSQEFKPNTFGCSNETISAVANAPTPNYSPSDPVLFFIYSISSIWYCLFSLLFIVVFGTLFSFLYSLIVSRSLDSDRNVIKERKAYLFSFRRHFLFG